MKFPPSPSNSCSEDKYIDNTDESLKKDPEDDSKRQKPKHYHKTDEKC